MDDSEKTIKYQGNAAPNCSTLSNGMLLQSGKYRIERCIASGGFGNTYEITNMTFGRRYALKEFFIKGVAERMEDTITVSVPIATNQPLFESQKEKFKREAVFLSELNNEHIVHVQDLFEENGTAYYVMDYIDGESLSARMKRTGQPLHESEAMNILNQLLRALGAAHAKNILHLDIKPANIVVNNEGHVTLIDFGASKQVDLDKGFTLTTTSLAYTPGYAPTEQIEQNKKRIGTWTDIYAVGATMYNLLTNQRPPLCADLVEDDALQLPPTVSSQTEELIRWMMQPATQKRPQNVNEVFDWMKRHGLQKAPMKLIGKGSRRKYTLIGVVTLVAVLLSVLFASMFGGKNEPNTVNKESNNDAIIQNLIANMVRVEGGTFMMGPTSEQGGDTYDWEKPAHQVTVSSFSIGKYEVTQEEWEAVMGSIPPEIHYCNFGFMGAKHPVVFVSWDECMEFIRKLNAKTGRNFRLPTEAEWEFAARGGVRSNNYKYSGSNNLNDVAWFTDNSGYHPHAVGGKQANELGLYDMSGNVWEWCSDWYGSYSSSSQTNPTGSTSGSDRVIRGGSWNNAKDCRVSSRDFAVPVNSSLCCGLRLAL